MTKAEILIEIQSVVASMETDGVGLDDTKADVTTSVEELVALDGNSSATLAQYQAAGKDMTERFALWQIKLAVVKEKSKTLMNLLNDLTN